MKNKLFTKNFTLLIAGQATSLFGNCILDFALSMYVLEVTGSAAVFAGFLAAAMLPTILLSPLGGILADRANRRNIMVLLDFLAGIAVLLAALLIGHGADLPVICAVLIIQSVLGAFETPTVQACVPQMQSGENLIRGNAVVNQVNAVSTLVAPFLGSLAYTAFGLKPVMFAGVACFLITSLFECFIRLENISPASDDGIFRIIKNDLISSTRFICRERPAILKTLLLAAVVSFFIQGTALVGLPYLIRTVLGLNANFYGAAESLLGCAGIAGGILAGAMAAKWTVRKLYLPIAAIGAALLPVGIVFLIPSGSYLRYGVLIAAFVIIQLTACIFSIFALSIIQQLTPVNMIGKVMAYSATISLCAQPFGQMIYGVLFDTFSNTIYAILIPTGLILCVIGIFAKGFFRNMEQKINGQDALQH